MATPTGAAILDGDETADAYADAARRRSAAATGAAHNGWPRPAPSTAPAGAQSAGPR
ncbi:MAG: hypothetical protein R2838_26555 [Caldilineaceae bacterium]